MAVAAPAAIAFTRSALPVWPDVWYVIARSADVRRGGILDGSIANRPYVIFRSQTGDLAALDAHCPHMGAHLRNGRVVGDRLRCPLHHWSFDRAGRIMGKGVCDHHRSRPWPVAERFGLVYLYAGTGTPPELPCTSGPETYAWLPAKPVAMATDWRAMMINGFDIQHMLTVHQRSLPEPPRFSRTPQGAFQMEYTSRVLSGGGFASWLIKKIANNRVQLRLTSYGTTILLEGSLGRIKSCAAFGFIQRGAAAIAYTSFATLRRGIFWPLRLWLTRWCFLAFLSKDFTTIDGMKMMVENADDVGVQNLADFLRTLPELSAVSDE